MDYAHLYLKSLVRYRLPVNSDGVGPHEHLILGRFHRVTTPTVLVAEYDCYWNRYGVRECDFKNIPAIFRWNGQEICWSTCSQNGNVRYRVITMFLNKASD